MDVGRDAGDREHDAGGERAAVEQHSERERGRQRELPLRAAAEHADADELAQHRQGGEAAQGDIQAMGEVGALQNDQERDGGDARKRDDGDVAPQHCCGTGRLTGVVMALGALAPPHHFRPDMRSA